MAGLLAFQNSKPCTACQSCGKIPTKYPCPMAIDNNKNSVESGDSLPTICQSSADFICKLVTQTRLIVSRLLGDSRQSDGC